MSFSMY